MKKYLGIIIFFFSISISICISFSPGTRNCEGFMIDHKNEAVYWLTGDVYQFMGDEQCQKITLEGLDYETFSIILPEDASEYKTTYGLSNCSNYYKEQSCFGVDKNHVYYKSDIIDDRAVSTSSIRRRVLIAILLGIGLFIWSKNTK